MGFFSKRFLIIRLHRIGVIVPILILVLRLTIWDKNMRLFIVIVIAGLEISFDGRARTAMLA